MAQHFDVSLKLLLMRSLGVVARAIFGGPVVEWLNVEMPSVRNLRADLLAKGQDGTYRHLELEVRNTRHWGRRVAEYHLRFHRILGVPVEMVVLYVGRKPLKMRSSFRTPWIQFKFRLIDIREFDGRFASSRAVNPRKPRGCS